MTHRPVEVLATVRRSPDNRWTAAASHGVQASAPSAAAACQRLAEKVAAAGTGRAGRVWLEYRTVHEVPDPLRTLTVRAVLVRSPLGEWLAAVSPPGPAAGDYVATAATPDTAVDRLGEHLAAAVAAGRVPGCPPEPTRIVLVTVRPATGQVRPTVTGGPPA